MGPFNDSRSHYKAPPSGLPPVEFPLCFSGRFNIIGESNELGVAAVVQATKETFTAQRPFWCLAMVVFWEAVVVIIFLCGLICKSPPLRRNKRKKVENPALKLPVHETVYKMRCSHLCLK